MPTGIAILHHMATYRGISDYTAYRKDRNNKIGGDVCIFAKSSHSISPINIDSCYEDLEVVAINLSIGNDVFTIVNIGL